MALKTKIKLRPMFDRVILAYFNDTYMYAVATAPTFAELHCMHPQRANTRKRLNPENLD